VDGWIAGPAGADWPWRRTAEFWDWWRGRSVTDMGLHLGHGAVRRTVMGNSPRRAEPSELRAMQELAKAEARYTLGLSTGLIYQPALYADRLELAALIRAANEVKPAAFFPHIRSESDAILEAVREAAEAAVEGGGGYCNEHTKIAGARNWPRIAELEALLDDAAASVPAVANMYLYTAGSTTGEAIFPPQFRPSRDELRRHLRSPASRRAIWEWLAGGAPGFENIHGYCGGLEGIRLAGVKPGPAEAFLGKRFSEVAAARGALDPRSFAALEAVMDFFLENDLAITIISFFGDDAVVRRLFQRESMAICTDGLMPGPGQKPHPRTLGTFPKALRYAREMGIALERIVHRITDMPARFLGLESLVLRPGADASLVLFDWEHVRERNDYDDPFVPPEGIEHVWVHGEHVLDRGELCLPSPFPGRVLRAV
jgi:N-acyl-D-aspartate/D-glutamate deacylase